MKRIGLLGCGSIGTQIAIAIDTGIIPAKLTHIFDENKEKSGSLVSKLKNTYNKFNRKILKRRFI